LRVLITNDDGIDAEGIALLEKSARNVSDDVWVVAPATNQSSCSRAITQTKRVACEMRAEQRFAVGGTPGDCVIIALNGLIPGKPPDMVLSGVNRGSNLGEDIATSGTVGACLQAWEQSVPGIAMSQVLANFKDKNTNWCSSQAHLEKILRQLVPLLLERPGVINVNFPPLDNSDKISGIEITEIGRRLRPLAVNSEKDEKGSLWFDYRSMRNKMVVTPQSDIDLAYRGYITLTPLTLDMADRARLSSFKKLIDPNRETK
jgi:5'-nucleotidase